MRNPTFAYRLPKRHHLHHEKTVILPSKSVWALLRGPQAIIQRLLGLGTCEHERVEIVLLNSVTHEDAIIDKILQKEDDTLNLAKNQWFTPLFDFFAFFDYTSVDNFVYTHPYMQPIIRLSVSEASKLFGVSQRTVRRAITAQEVTYVVVQGRYKINFESLLRWSQHTTTVRNKRDKQGIGQYVDQWKVKNKLFSPNPSALQHEVWNAHLSFFSLSRLPVASY